MKQVKLLILSILLGITLSAAGVPPDTYAPGKTITVNGSTYICREFYGAVQLNNTANKLTDVMQIKTDGSPMLLKGPNKYEAPVDFGRKIKSTIFSCLTFPEFEMVKEEMLVITMYIDSNNGWVTEVNFGIRLDTKYATLLPDRYYRLEQALKNIRFTLTEEGRTYNYNVCIVPLIIPEGFTIDPSESLPIIDNVFQESVDTITVFRDQMN
jgi:hypothetical protein